MPLRGYKRKRDFGKTTEPEGKLKESRGKNIFVIQEHHARRLHWDFRLEREGVLKSWAIPKEPPQKEGIRRLAVQTEDHPLEYAAFEGTIPAGQYGAGIVKIWDRGTFIPQKISEREIIFELKGRKMKGDFRLIKLKPTPHYKEKNNWLFFKKKG